MTPKEAIAELKKVDTLDMPARLCEAHYMSIKALEQEPCEDAISRQSTLKPYEGLKDDDVIAVWLIRKNIEQQLSVNPQEPKTGYWIDDNGIYAWCSCCKEHIYQTGEFNYCPNCGAKMQEVEE